MLDSIKHIIISSDKPEIKIGDTLVHDGVEYIASIMYISEGKHEADYSKIYAMVKSDFDHGIIQYIVPTTKLSRPHGKFFGLTKRSRMLDSLNHLRIVPDTPIPLGFLPYQLRKPEYAIKVGNDQYIVIIHVKDHPCLLFHHISYSIENDGVTHFTQLGDGSVYGLRLLTDKDGRNTIS